MSDKMERIRWQPGRRITIVDGEWVVVDAEGKIIARDLHISEADVEWLKAEIIKKLREGT